MREREEKGERRKVSERASEWERERERERESLEGESESHMR